jgi:hypothetical protein
MNSTYLKKFKDVIRREYSDLEILDLLRILNGIGILFYYFDVLIPNFKIFFLKEGLVVPEAFEYFPHSWVFFFQQNEIAMVCIIGFIITTLLTYTIGFYSKWSLLLLLPLHLGIHAVIPFIVGEPQTLSNLLLIITLFLPIENVFALRPRNDLLPHLNRDFLRNILLSLLAYFSFYYFFSGLKKVPDQNWVQGRAVFHILNWPYIGKDNLVSHFFRLPFITEAITYITLLFEIGFIFIAFSRLKKFLIPIGLFFHLFIAITMDVGHLFWAMMSWYPLLLLKDIKLEFKFNKNP